MKLTDFGLNKRLDSEEKSKGFCGTAQYFAPEVFVQIPYDVLPTDIWRLGVLLYLFSYRLLLFRETVLSNINYDILSWSCWIPYHFSPEFQNVLKIFKK